MNKDWGKISNNMIEKIKLEFKEVLDKHSEVETYILNYKNIKVS